VQLTMQVLDVCSMGREKLIDVQCSSSCRWKRSYRKYSIKLSDIDEKACRKVYG